MLLKGNLPPKINSYGNILPGSYLLYVFEFQLVLIAFSFILGDPFMVSPPPQYAFHGGQFLWGKFIGGLFYMGGLMIISYQGGSSFTKCIFQ